MVAPDNLAVVEAWNTRRFAALLRFRHLVTDGWGCHGDAALARHRPPSGGHVLDIGCGFGDTTLQIARAVGPAGRAVGLDAAERYIEEARRSAEAEGVSNASFVVADAQSEPLGGPYDQAFARFGTMFFANPVAAFRNVHGAMKPGATISFVVWRTIEDNAFFRLGDRCVRDVVAELRGREVPAGPGPFSMASCDVVSTQLLAAGFRGVMFERFDAPICIGRDLDEAVTFSASIGPAAELMRLASDITEQQRADVHAALRAVLADFVRADGVFAPSSTWIVSATAA